MIFVLGTILYQILLDFEALWKSEIVAKDGCEILSSNLFFSLQQAYGLFQG